MKTPRIVFPASLCVWVATILGTANAVPSPSGTGEGDESPMSMIDLDTASREIKRLNPTNFGFARLEPGDKPVVSEYGITGLWKELRMQIFRVARNDKPMTGCILYLYAAGQMNRLTIPTHGSAGLQDAAVLDRSLYLTSDWGSGILRTALYRIHCDERGEVQTEELGVLSSAPKGLVNKEFLEDEGVVRITKALRPITIKRKPTDPAPKPEDNEKVKSESEGRSQ